MIDLDLSFLDTGASRPGPGGKQDWEMVSWSDGPDANTDAQSFRRTTTVVGREALLHVGLAPGGGLAARISRRSTARTPRKP